MDVLMPWRIQRPNVWIKIPNIKESLIPLISMTHMATNVNGMYKTKKHTHKYIMFPIDKSL